ncbi:hypothetical protein GCM10010129_70370 [Streptomyces fumigatiscleroticus]|nr:hypothetical protein GCM10010129_70370 [Streptomyces fumigatiscleroticus]
MPGAISSRLTVGMRTRTPTPYGATASVAGSAGGRRLGKEVRGVGRARARRGAAGFGLRGLIRGVLRLPRSL